VVQLAPAVSPSLQAPAAANRPSLVRGVVLRFAFCYWMLFCIPVLATQVVGLDRIGKLVMPLWNAMVVWVGHHVLAISSELDPAENGSGDKITDWVSVFCVLGLALIATAVWSAVDRRRAHDARLRELLRVVVRYTVALVIMGYGVSKVFFGQFPPPSPSRLVEQFGDASPMGLMWTFMGASPAYVLFSGAAEVLGALLLLFRRTATLGALVLGVVLTNIVLMNFCYDIPAKIASAHYLAMCVFLLLPELGRLADVLVLHRPTQPGLRPLVLPRRWIRIARRVAKYGVIAYVLAINIEGAAFGQLELGPRPWYDGYWNATAFRRDGQDVPPLITDVTRWRRLRFQVAGDERYLRWRFMDDSLGDLYTFTIDETAHTVALAPAPEDVFGKPRRPTGPLVLRFSRPDADHLSLEGVVGGEQLSVQLERFATDKMLLVSRGFHWINPEPFNR